MHGISHKHPDLLLQGAKGGDWFWAITVNSKSLQGCDFETGARSKPKCEREGSRGFPCRQGLRPGRVGVGSSTPATPASVPAGKSTHFMNREREAVTVGISSGMMAKKRVGGWRQLQGWFSGL